MAENLTVPSDFSKPKPKVPNMNLLPPSAFEAKPKQGNPWNEIAKATEEMVKLKLENTKLKEAQKVTPEVVPTAPVAQEQIQKPIPDMCRYPRQKDDFKYVDELINKQACEITELKNELRSLKCQQREELSEMEKQYILRERDYTNSIASLEADLKTAESRYENQVDRLSREHGRETDDMSATIDKLQQEVAGLRVRSGQTIEDLEIKYAQLKQTTSETIDSLTHDLRLKDSLIENQAKQIMQLKKYIGETDNLPKPTDIARKEKESLVAKLKTYESESESLNSTVQLLNIRLDSMNEILKLQELEVTKSSTNIEKSKNENLLLTRWREKVFALMVQQKSSEITCKKDDINWKSKISDLEKELSSSRNQIEQLTHALSEKDAQVSMERNSNIRIQGELSEAQHLALSLDDRIQDNVQHSNQLQELAASVWCKFQENQDTLNTALAGMKAYGQRISFASSRVEMLQGLFARREAMLKLQIGDGNIPEKDVAPDKVMSEDTEKEGSLFLHAELEKVTRERDNLASQIKQDSNMWDDKVTSIQKQVEDELNSLKQTKMDLELIVQEKTQKLSELSERLEICQNDLDYANQSIEELKSAMATQEMNVEQLLEEQRREIENQCSDKFADLDRQLNEAKREHAKAVVSLRQLERQTAREKERNTEHLSTVEEHYKQQIDKLQELLRSVEKERNLMMATLRQEGLVGKMKSERGEPVMPSWYTDEEPVLDNAQPTTPREVTNLETQHNDPEEPLTSVLEDLQSLTSAVLKDDNSESGSDEES